MRKRRPEHRSAAVREAETALMRALCRVVEDIGKLQVQIVKDATFLLEQLDDASLPGKWKARVQRRLERMQRDWPELLDNRKGD